GDDGPDAVGLLVYGQSGDPASPHHTDQLDDFAAKRLRPLRFTDEAIAADPDRSHRTVSG
ncbi:MAG: penicillin acylase family protein, partial [Alphaproteobacteria bacterium]|nr:penicillin acylase family protein [Alphaproteobacteria bacterium]